MEKFQVFKGWFVYLLLVPRPQVSPAPEALVNLVPMNLSIELEDKMTLSVVSKLV